MPWIQPLRSYIQQAKPEQLRFEMGPGASDIAEIIPEMRAKLPDPEPPPSLEPEHARIGEALVELYGTEVEAHAAELAYHFAQCQPVSGVENLVHYSLMAGEQALTAYAYEEALAPYEKALAAKVGQPTDTQTAALLFGLGRAKAVTP